MNTAERFRSAQDRAQDLEMEAAFNTALKELQKSLESGDKKRRKSADRKSVTSKISILEKAQIAYKEGRIDLVTAGIIENRVNKNIPLDERMIKALDLPQKLVKAFPDTGQAVSAEREPNRLSAHKMRTGDRYSFTSRKSGNEITVTKGEILKACQKRVRKGELDIHQAGVIEYRLNKSLKIDSPTLRDLFGD